MPRKVKTRTDKDYYEVLQVDRRAQPEVIKAAYRALMKQYHHDVNPGHTIYTIQLNQAHEILMDLAKRKEYDLQLGTQSLDGAIVGEYRIMDEIASGAIGDTYLAEHLLIGEKVCVKHCANISAVAEEILFNEARAVWDLRHFALPNMRNVLKLDDGTIALVMSYIEGPTLFELVEEHGRLEAEHVAWIMGRHLNALQYLHYHGVIHGDIKPQNSIIQPEIHMAVIVDFGLSQIKPTENTRSIGYTELFAPPEEISGRPLLPQSDFYSLGMTMLFALTGDVDAVKRLQVPSDVPDPLCNFIKRLIVRDILSRPDWQKEDLCDTFAKVRKQAFGRKNSGMKPITYTKKR